jgi:hypothetical protein
MKNKGGKMAGLKTKTALKIIGGLTLVAGVLPLLKPYVGQLAVIPTDGVVLPIEVVVLGLLGLYWGFNKSTY